MDWRLLGLAILPVVVLVVYVYCQDRYQKEPVGMLLKALLAGAFCTIPAIFLERGISLFAPPATAPFANGLFQGFAVAGFSEELCKLTLLTLVVWRSRYFDEYMDGIVYATCVSLGFAGVENILYVFGSGDYAQAVATGTMRAILSVPGHFLFGVVMGYYFALAKFMPHYRPLRFLQALVYPLLLHGTFDSLLMIPENLNRYALVTVVFFVAFLWFDIKLWKIGKRRLRHLQELSEEQNEAKNSNFDPPDGETGGQSDAFEGIDWNV